MAENITNFKINADASNYVSVLSKMHQETQQTFAGITSIIGKFSGVFSTLVGVAAGGAVFRDAINTYKDWTGEVVGLAKAMGDTTEQASVFNAALKIMGVSQDVAVSASMRLAQAVNKGSDAFETLGISVRDSSGKFRPTSDVMGEVNKKLAEMPAGLDRNTLGIQIYGKGWAEVSSILKITTPVLDDAAQFVEKIGLAVTGKGADALKQFEVSTNKLKLALTGLKVTIGEEVMPTFELWARKSAELFADEYGLGGVLAFLAHPIDFTKYQFSLFKDHSGTTWQQWKERQAAGSAAAQPVSGPSAAQLADDKKNREYMNQQADKEEEAKRRLNNQIEDLLNKRTKNELEQIDIQAAAWRNEGADQVRVANWVAAEKEKINHDLMKKVFSDMNQANEKRYEVEVAKAKEAQEQIAKAYEEGMATEKNLIEQERLTIEYAASNKELEASLQSVIGKSQELATAEKNLIDGENKLLKLNLDLRVAWLDHNAAAIAGLTRRVQLQEEENQKLAEQKQLLQEVGVLTGEIVGFDNGDPVLANSWQSQNQYQSAAALARSKQAQISAVQSVNTGFSLGSFDLGIQYVDANGNPIKRSASGNHLNAGEPSFVGEKGIELFVPDRAGTVVPNDKIVMPGQSKNSGGVTLNGDLVCNITVTNASNITNYRDIARGIYSELRKLDSYRRSA